MSISKLQSLYGSVPAQNSSIYHTKNMILLRVFKKRFGVDSTKINSNKNFRKCSFMDLFNEKYRLLITKLTFET